MDFDEADFSSEVAALEERQSHDLWAGIEGLRRVHERWARALLGLPADGSLVKAVRAAVEAGVSAERALKASTHLAIAEEHQWALGTTSSGSGEGLASMAQVRFLQLAQAWLLSVSAAHEDLARSLEFATTVEADPNGPARVHRLGPHIAALKQRVTERLGGERQSE